MASPMAPQGTPGQFEGLSKYRDSRSNSEIQKPTLMNHKSFSGGFTFDTARDSFAYLYREMLYGGIWWFILLGLYGSMFFALSFY